MKKQILISFLVVLLTALPNIVEAQFFARQQILVWDIYDRVEDVKLGEGVKAEIRSKMEEALTKSQNYDVYTDITNIRGILKSKGLPATPINVAKEARKKGINYVIFTTLKILERGQSYEDYKVQLASDFMSTETQKTERSAYVDLYSRLNEVPSACSKLLTDLLREQINFGGQSTRNQTYSQQNYSNNQSYGSVSNKINGHEYVDLGLPSGIKWATCNVGANTPEEYGDYFAWGETSPKSSYTESNYTYSSNPPTLPLSADAANVNWGGNWRMPTKAELEELIDKNNCAWTWTSQNGVNGYKVTSKKNGNSIFLPAAGYRVNSLSCNKDYGYYWSSSLKVGDSDNTCQLYFYGLNDVYYVDVNFSYRPFYGYNGQSVRPVCDSTINNSSNYTNNQSHVSKDYVENAENLNMKMVYVEGGSFIMGATEEQSGDAESNESPSHRVTLDSYYIGAFEVTQAQWRAIMGNNPSYFTGDNNPVEKVSWHDAQAFCKELSNLTGRTYMLPTEAQWEYAARGGNKSRKNKYSGSFAIDVVAWYKSNSGSITHPVGGKRANELGLYDMSGNVWEWCNDWYGSYSSSPQTNPTGPSSGQYRVLRGGSWLHDASSCRVSDRCDYAPSNVDDNSGFRVVCLP